ncbi:hypothetical protein MO973_06440 [Paenibacillus sp. TRM 82003]|uniref:hypothetical protein n=1 Tax=Kineococcus sp. TRM81007 TaxID=2925831 RepID=UPI001F585BDC|nr:hypothetical protein [Kineococcus sp. TRM81007]MCI2237513.1 hypothetical protein [Kineococcus sp. TRM81007]MCI3919867.1 hypothetical protein [Paenibacillus sp. TRM 82003]
MAVWTSFMDLVHLVGAAGSVALAAGFTADGETARALFYAVVAVAFAVALVRRRAQRRADAPAAPAVVDLRPAAAPAARQAGAGLGGAAEPDPQRPAA